MAAGGCLVWVSLPHTSVTIPGAVSSKPAGERQKGGEDGEKDEGEKREQDRNKEREKNRNWGTLVKNYA